MTTYTFTPNPSEDLVQWDDPTVWSGLRVPDSGNADVAFPLVTTTSTGTPYVSFVTISPNESFAVRSLDDLGDYLIVNGSLAVSGAINLGKNAEIDLDGSLSFGSLTSSAYDIQGEGQINTPNVFTNTPLIIGSGLTLTVPDLINNGSLMAAASSADPVALTVILTDPGEASSFAGGTLTGGIYRAFFGGSMDLDVGSLIQQIDATVILSNSGSQPNPALASAISSFDPVSLTYLSLQTTVKSIGGAGTLFLDKANYTASNNLLVSGAIALDASATISTSNLDIASSGRVTGFGTVIGSIVNDGVIESGANPDALSTQTVGSLIIGSEVTGSGSLAVASGSTLELKSGSSESVTFSGANGILTLDAPDEYTGVITAVKALSAFDKVAFTDISLGSVIGYTHTGDANGGVLSIEEDGSGQSLKFSGSYTTSDFVLAAGPQPLSSSLPSLLIEVACYVLGTNILTIGGDAPVESLRIGDIVITASGRHCPVKWIGRRSYVGHFLAANPNVQPIRFRAGSHGASLPRRDLLVSPDHAMFLHGRLVPARHLVNGATIAQERGLERVDYFHVELDSHDVLLAEGAPSESFMDDDSRGAFHNASEFVTLYPHAPGPGRFCAPRVTDGYELEAIRQRLALVAQRMAIAA